MLPLLPPLAPQKQRAGNPAPQSSTRKGGKLLVPCGWKMITAGSFQREVGRFSKRSRFYVMGVMVAVESLPVCVILPELKFSPGFLIPACYKPQGDL